MKEILEKLLRRENLSREEASAMMRRIMAGQCSDVQIAGMLIALRAKGETVDEIAGVVATMRDHAVRVSPVRDGLVDTCGTGGDGARTFNISTAAALVAAGAGVAVAKHGNRAVSSNCGSSDVLDALGVATVPPARVAEVIDRVGIGFMFAPAHHPATRHAAVARRDLGVRTLFNLIGPMTNPAFVRRQLMGIFDPALTETVAEVLRTLGSEKVYVVHGLDGSDEVSIVLGTKVTLLDAGTIRTFTFEPESVGIRKTSADAIAGGAPAENASIIESILGGEIGPRRDAVLLNAAFVLSAAGKSESIADGVAEGRQSIDSGRARTVLQTLRDVTAEIAARAEGSQ